MPNAGWFPLKQSHQAPLVINAPMYFYIGRLNERSQIKQIVFCFFIVRGIYIIKRPDLKFYTFFKIEIIKYLLILCFWRLGWDFWQVFAFLPNRGEEDLVYIHFFNASYLFINIKIFPQKENKQILPYFFPKSKFIIIIFFFYIFKNPVVPPPLNIILNAMKVKLSLSTSVETLL